MRLICGCIYFVLLVVLSVTLWQFRHWAVDDSSQRDANQAWSQWQEETESTSEDPNRSVSRRPATSNESPAIVLLRDYFVTSWFGLAALGSVVFWSMAWMLGGAIRTATKVPHEEDVSEEEVAEIPDEEELDHE